jgi:hypothetical protein
MKKIFQLIALLLLIQTASKAQGDLQFNQVLSYTGWIDTYTPSPIWTVPQGKVWKVESYTKNFLKINNVSINDNTNNGPIWLKSGDILQCSSWPNAAPYNGYNYLFSILEFNITP